MSCAVDMVLDGVWEDAPNYGGVAKKMYIVRTSPCGSRITVDVYDLKEPSRWLFGGAHLMRRNRTGTSLLWGAQGVNKYKSDVRTAVESRTICWYRCGDSSERLLPSWVWRQHQGHHRHQSVVQSSRVPSPCWWTSCNPQDDLFAMSEYDPEEWWPARFVCILQEEGGADPLHGSIVVSTQDGTHTWTVPMIGGAVKA